MPILAPHVSSPERPHVSNRPLPEPNHYGIRCSCATLAAKGASRVSRSPEPRLLSPTIISVTANTCDMLTVQEALLLFWLTNELADSRFFPRAVCCEEAVASNLPLFFSRCVQCTLSRRLNSAPNRADFPPRVVREKTPSRNNGYTCSPVGQFAPRILSYIKKRWMRPL